MSKILEILASIFGAKAGGSIVNNLGGAINHGAFLAALTWVLADPEAMVRITTSRLSLLVYVAIIWAILEVFRRSRPGG